MLQQHESESLPENTSQPENRSENQHYAFFPLHLFMFDFFDQYEVYK